MPPNIPLDDAPLPIREVVGRSLAADPHQRFTSMRAFGEALRGTQQALGLTATTLKIGSLLPPDLSPIDAHALGWQGPRSAPPILPGPPLSPTEYAPTVARPHDTGPPVSYQTAPPAPGTTSKRGLLIGAGVLALVVLAGGGTALALSGGKSSRTIVTQPLASGSATPSASASASKPVPTDTPSGSADISTPDAVRAAFQTPIGFTPELTGPAADRISFYEMALVVPTSDFTACSPYMADSTETPPGQEIAVCVIHYDHITSSAEASGATAGLMTAFDTTDPVTIDDSTVTALANSPHLGGSIGIHSGRHTLIVVFDSLGDNESADDILATEVVALDDE